MFRRLLAKWSAQRPRRRAQAFHPVVKCLEDRCLLSTSALAPVLSSGAPDFDHSPAIHRQASRHREAHFSIISQLTAAHMTAQSASTVPANGDQNPYGVAFIPHDFASGRGPLRPGDVLVSNFNDKTNTQGTGTTIVRVTPDGQQSVFFQGTAPLGLTTALGVLKQGFVIVGNVPTTADSKSPSGRDAQQGSLLILNNQGQVVLKLTDKALLDGPWDLTIRDEGARAQVFISNVLSGTVTRLDLKIPHHGHPVVESLTQIASGFTHKPNAAAVVVGPTGLAYDAKNDILYVASTGDNAIYAIRDAADRQTDAGRGRRVIQDPHLSGPLGLVLAPNGDLIAANGDAVEPSGSTEPPNEILEFNPNARPGHRFVGQFQLDPGNPGAAFGIALASFDGNIDFAAVNDNQNMVDVWAFKP